MSLSVAELINQTDLLGLSGKTLHVTAGSAPALPSSPHALLCQYINLQLINAKPQGMWAAGLLLHSLSLMQVLALFTCWCTEVRRFSLVHGDFVYFFPSVCFLIKTIFILSFYASSPKRRRRASLRQGAVVKREPLGIVLLFLTISSPV